MEAKTNERELLLHVGSSPHVRTDNSTQHIMLTVIIALIPAIVASFIFFGIDAIIVTLVAVLSCVVAEAVMQKALKKPLRIADLSAVVTGILIAFNVPSTMPLWMVVFGSIFAIVVVKEMFGGIGNNFVNPALAARAVLLASWPAQMGTYVQPYTLDAVTSGTPLANPANANLMDLFIGAVPGTLGEVSAVALLVGALILLWRGIIKLRIPVAMVAAFAVGFIVFNAIELSLNEVALGDAFSQTVGILPAQILSGGLMLGAIFMATDYSSSPITSKGQLIFGIGAGLLVALFRVFGQNPEGVSYAILIMNVCTPLIDKYVKEKPFGGVQ